ncbi:hypothetical protein V6N13_147743 [Hibiscus sabdariffa]
MCSLRHPPQSYLLYRMPFVEAHPLMIPPELVSCTHQEERLSVFRDCFVLSIVDEKTHGALYCNRYPNHWTTMEILMNVRNNLSLGSTAGMKTRTDSVSIALISLYLALFHHAVTVAERLLNFLIMMLLKVDLRRENSYRSLLQQTHSHKEALELTFSITDGHGELCFRIWRMP